MELIAIAPWLDAQTVALGVVALIVGVARELCMQQESQQHDVVAGCQQQREERAAAPYTIADAIADARWLRRTPDGLMAPDKQRRLVEALLSALERSKCYFNATVRGQEVFVLVQQDRAAPAAIRTWADTAAAHGCKSEKVLQAYQEATRWEDQPTGTTKWPD